MQYLHTRIKSSRLEQGLSQARLAKETGVSQPTVANWETGSHIPRRQALEKISRALNVEQDWLLSGSNDQRDTHMETYLSKPIRHVPIYAWPTSEPNPVGGRPIAYLPYPTEDKAAFALIDENTPGLRHRILILTPHTDRDVGLCFWTHDGLARLTQQDAVPAEAQIIGHLKTEIKSYR